MGNNISRIMTGLILAVCVAGCGGSGNSSGANVGEVNVQDSAISTGGSTVVEIEFSFDSDEVFNHSETVFVIARLPAGLVYKRGSSEVDVVGGNDTGVEADVQTCAGGATVITYSLEKQDLLLAFNPGGNADARVTFTVDAAAPTQGIIEARGDDSGSFSCEAFGAEATASIQVS